MRGRPGKIGFPINSDVYRSFYMEIARIYMTGEKDRFSRTPRGVVTRAQLEDDANASPGKRLLDLQRMWVQRAVCRLLAMNLSSFAGSVGLRPLIFAESVGSKSTLFASPLLTVCKPLHLESLR
jgi:hypothetical protein